MFSSAMLCAMKRLIPHFSVILVITAVVVFLVGCGGNPPMMQSSSMGTINVSMSDPPSCAAASSATTVPAGGTAAPGGNFMNVFVTIRSIQAHTSATADNTSSGWQELAPQLVSAPMQVDLLHLPANGQCLLEQLGSTSLPAGQSVDLNIDFNTCASILMEGNGDFRLKPALTAGVVSANKTGISGQIVDSVSSQPIAGAIVTLQFADKSGTDRVVMQQLTDSAGQFSFCPLAVGAVFDVVSDALSASGTAYNATVVLNVPGGTNLGAVPLVAETPATEGASTGPGTIQGTITAINGTTGATIDADVSALQSVTVSSTTHTFTVPLFPNSVAADIMVTSSTSCPTGAPKGAFCGSYTLVVPASNPTVGTFSAGKTVITSPATGDVLYTVEADASNPTSDVAMCSPSSQTASKDSTTPTAMPLKVTAGATSPRLTFLKNWPTVSRKFV